VIPNLDQLLRHPHIWRGQDGLKKNLTSIGTGFEALDTLLPGGGWPVGGLTQILIDNHGIGELRLVMPALAGISQHHWIAWIAPPYIPYAPALKQHGIQLQRVLSVRAKNRDDCFWAVEQSLRAGACMAVLAWVDGLARAQLRRLQLAAETGRAVALLFSHRQNTSPAPVSLRLQLRACHQGLRIDILKRRGAWATGPVFLTV